MNIILVVLFSLIAPSYCVPVVIKYESYHADKDTKDYVKLSFTKEMNENQSKDDLKEVIDEDALLSKLKVMQDITIQPPFVNEVLPMEEINIPIQSAVDYRPLVIIHGLMGEENTLRTLINFIKKERPGIEVHEINILMSFESLEHPMWDQVDQFYDKMEPIMRKSKNGINLMGFSQGGLIARAILEKYDHNVHNFISLSAPLAGQFGDAYINYFLITKESAYKIFYSEKYQKEFSIAGYWNDPYHQEIYLKVSTFLPYIDNVKTVNVTYQKNFEKLNKLILIGGPDDGVISPWQSSHFGFSDDTGAVRDFTERDVYKNNLFGLRTLHEQDKIQLYTRPDTKHFEWHENHQVAKDFILPWL